MKAIFPGGHRKDMIGFQALKLEEFCFLTHCGVHPHWANKMGSPGAGSSNGTQPTTSSPLSPVLYGENAASEIFTRSLRSLARALILFHKFRDYPLDTRIFMCYLIPIRR